ncbi:unnamed protein product, partial [marine sediment metagenome]
LNHEYRFWKVAECKLPEEKKIEVQEKVRKIIELEDA